jgi:membrane associated rhomboid family serine protease
VKSIVKPFIIALLTTLLPVVAYYLFQQSRAFALDGGLVPWDLHHWPGILLMPLIHDGAAHLWGNSVQLFFGTILVFIHFRHLSWLILTLQWVGAGLLLFFLGQPGTLHVGSSGVIYGLFSYLICAGFLSGNRRLRLLSFMLLMYYGSMIWGVFPWQEKVSWEGHLSGVISGVFTAFILMKQYRAFTKDRKPSWFSESDKREDPYAPFDRQS